MLGILSFTCCQKQWNVPEDSLHNGIVWVRPWIFCNLGPGSEWTSSSAESSPNCSVCGCHGRLLSRWVKMGSDRVRCQMASVVGSAIPPAPVDHKQLARSTLHYFSSSLTLGSRECESCVSASGLAACLFHEPVWELGRWDHFLFSSWGWFVHPLAMIGSNPYTHSLRYIRECRWCGLWSWQEGCIFLNTVK